MKLEKKKVHGNITFSSSAKATIAASLGVAASFAMSACISDSSETRIEEPKDSQKNCGMEKCDKDFISSSSSKVIDIPKSYEHYSSSVIEALSSASQPATQPSSSNNNDENIQVNPKIDSTLPPNTPTIKDTLIPNIHLCKDPNCHEFIIDSMVTTLETSDIA